MKFESYQARKYTLKYDHQKRRKDQGDRKILMRIQCCDSQTEFYCFLIV